jgi:hypothetical protein
MKVKIVCEVPKEHINDYVSFMEATRGNYRVFSVILAEKIGNSFYTGDAMWNSEDDLVSALWCSGGAQLVRIEKYEW